MSALESNFVQLVDADVDAPRRGRLPEELAEPADDLREAHGPFPSSWCWTRYPPRLRPAASPRRSSRARSTAGTPVRSTGRAPRRPERRYRRGTSDHRGTAAIGATRSPGRGRYRRPRAGTPLTAGSD